LLAMCLLKSEILDNGDNAMTSVAKLKTLKFLDRSMFGQFKALEDNTRRFTYRKGCRLIDVELTASGIATRGHLWKIG
jgi:hypothetical protein